MRTEAEIKSFLNVVKAFHVGYVQMGFTAECEDSIQVMEAVLQWILESEGGDER